MLKDVDKAIARRDFGSALAHAKAAYDGYGEDPDAVAVWAWARSHASEAPDDVLKSCLVDLDKSLAGSDDLVRARYYRGMIQKRLGNVSAAMRDFGHVARLDPHHVDAARELRLFNMRASGKKK